MAVGFKKYGDYEKLKSSPIKHLFDVYVKANNDDTIKDEALSYFCQMEARECDFLFKKKNKKNKSSKIFKQKMKKQ